MAKEGELKVGDMVRYWARTPTSSPHLDGYVGRVEENRDSFVYVRWVTGLTDKRNADMLYGAQHENLDKIELLP